MAPEDDSVKRDAATGESARDEWITDPISLDRLEELESSIGELVDFIRDNAPEDQDSFGKYQIKQLIQQSPHAFVVKAFDPVLERIVLLKVYPAKDSINNAHNVYAEGRACSKITSPFVAKCLSIEEWDEQPFLVLDFIKGSSITETVEYSPLNESEALEIVGKIAEGLQEIHNEGFLHLDLKPCNIMLDYERNPKIVDFGLARPINEIIVDRFAGTPGYVAPELSGQQSEIIGRQTDVYGLGAILYYMLTGFPPSDGETKKEKLLNSTLGKFDKSKLIEKGVSRRTIKIISKALSKHPSNRFKNAAQFQAAVKPDTTLLKRALVATVALTALIIVSAISLTFGFTIGYTPDRDLPPNVKRVLNSLGAEQEVGINRSLAQLVDERGVVHVPQDLRERIDEHLENTLGLPKWRQQRALMLKNSWMKTIHFLEGNPEAVCECLRNQINIQKRSLELSTDRYHEKLAELEWMKKLSTAKQEQRSAFDNLMHLICQFHRNRFEFSQARATKDSEKIEDCIEIAQSLACQMGKTSLAEELPRYFQNNADMVALAMHHEAYQSKHCARPPADNAKFYRLKQERFELYGNHLDWRSLKTQNIVMGTRVRDFDFEQANPATVGAMLDDFKRIDQEYWTYAEHRFVPFVTYSNMVSNWIFRLVDEAPELSPELLQEAMDYNQKLTSDALEIGEKIQQNNMNYARTHLCAAQIHYFKGEKDEATDHLREAKSLFDSSLVNGPKLHQDAYGTFKRHFYRIASSVDFPGIDLVVPPKYKPAKVHRLDSFAPHQERGWNGTPSIDASQNNRLWLAWSTNDGDAPGIGDYVILAATSRANPLSADTTAYFKLDLSDGRTVIESPWLWSDPAGQLWLFYFQATKSQQIPNHYDFTGTCAIRIEDAQSEAPRFSEPVVVDPSAKICGRPFAITENNWIVPIFSHRRVHNDQIKFVRTMDRGQSWQISGGPPIPVSKISTTQLSVFKKRDGRLNAVFRTKSGQEQIAFSPDCKTWGPIQKFRDGPNAKAELIALNNSHLAFVSNCPEVPDKDSRSRLGLMFSPDSGRSWKSDEPLIFDERCGLSHPALAECPLSGDLFVIYERWGRGRPPSTHVSVEGAGKSLFLFRLTKDQRKSGTFDPPQLISQGESPPYNADRTQWLESSDRVKSRITE